MMAQNPDSPPAATPPEDNRPRPQYGELAPEGWTWTPPQDGSAVPAEPQGKIVPAPAGPPDRLPAPGRLPTPVTTQERTGAPGWDRPVTLGLLIFGLLATFWIASGLYAVPEAMQALYTQQGLSSYTPAPTVAGLVTGGVIAEVVVWLATAAVSILLIVRRKRAFYVPLIGGFVSIVVMFALVSFVIAGDPTLLDSISSQ